MLKIQSENVHSRNEATTHQQPARIIELNFSGSLFKIRERVLCHCFNPLEIDKKTLITLAVKAEKQLKEFVLKNDKNLSLLKELYQAIKDQIPPEKGRIRVVSAYEFKAILDTGAVPSASDFAQKGAAVRIGHNGYFVALQVANEAQTEFINGSAGSSELNRSPIYLKDLKVYIPALKSEAHLVRVKRAA